MAVHEKAHLVVLVEEAHTVLRLVDRGLLVKDLLEELGQQEALVLVAVDQEV
jgi:sulfur carrier protein ThiS